VLETGGEDAGCTMYISCFCKWRRRVFNDGFLEFISMSLFEVEIRGTGVRVVNGGEWKRDIDEEMVRTQTWVSAPCVCGAN